MKIVLVAAIAALTLGQKKCSNKKLSSSVSSTCFKGRLEVKGPCANYTIKLLEGGMDTSNLVASWQNDATKKTYTNVFALASACSFPDSIREGDEFYFALGSKPQNCMVCMIYYPKPPKALSITVLAQPCQ